MKKFLASSICLLVGLAIGFFGGYRYYERHITKAVHQMMEETMESSDGERAVKAAHAPLPAAIDRVVPNKDVQLNANILLHVLKRDGSSLGGISIITKKANGVEIAMTAATGTISQGIDRDWVKIMLKDAQTQNATMISTDKVMVVDIKQDY